ncbi:hypothetical protein NT6N_02590 [Oceaniferula spumae]|uniref:Uncharacterized protein n=1 Tax=Oceaniferula spumae TaxID=2979115 RepID=A0AAT9FGX0_9BACT
MKSPKKTSGSSNMRWFLILNISIAVVLVCAAGILKKGSAGYQGQATFDRNYIAMTKAEKDNGTLKRGIVYTEAARADAYRSLMNISHGASITWILVAVAFIMNAAFIFRMSRKHELMLADAHAA